MQIKVFEAPDMTSGLKQIKKALGPDALILSSRTIKKGTMGVLGKPMLEITAASDEAWPEDKGYNATLSVKQASTPKREPIIQKPDNLTYDTLWKEESREKLPVSDSIDTTSTKTTPIAYAHRNDDSLKEEINELRSLIYGLNQHIATLNITDKKPAFIDPVPANNIPLERKIPGSDNLLQMILAYGINEKAGRTIAKFVKDSLSKRKLQDEAVVDHFLTKSISDLFAVRETLVEKQQKQKRISLIGPTGVGKTTTIAKLAANYLSQFGSSIALITIDTYRVAAVEQLKVYGEIMKLPVEVVIRPDELELALDKHKDCELILIDTAGRNPHSGPDMKELINFLRPHLHIENHLVLSATTREDEQFDIINRFHSLPIEGTIFTKIDECVALGTLLNIHIKKDTPISFLTNGQRVPEDIITPSSRTIAELIVNNYRTLKNG